MYPLPLNCLDPLPFHAAVRYVEAKHVVRTGSTSSALLLKSESSLPVAGAFAVFFMGIELSVCKCRPLFVPCFLSPLPLFRVVWMHSSEILLFSPYAAAGRHLRVMRTRRRPDSQTCCCFLAEHTHESCVAMAIATNRCAGDWVEGGRLSLFLDRHLTSTVSVLSDCVCSRPLRSRVCLVSRCTLTSFVSRPDTCDTSCVL